MAVFLHGIGNFVDKGPMVGLEQLLFADCGYEFLEVERFEVCDVFESVCVEGFHGWCKH